MFSWITTKIALIGAGVLGVVLLGFGVYHWILVSSLEGKITDLQAKNGTLQVDLAVVTANRDSLLTTIETQNRKIDAFVGIVEETSKQAVEAIKEEQQKSATWKRKYGNILGTLPPVPTTPESPTCPDTCAALKMRMDQYLATRLEEGK